MTPLGTLIRAIHDYVEHVTEAGGDVPELPQLVECLAQEAIADGRYGSLARFAAMLATWPQIAYVGRALLKSDAGQTVDKQIVRWWETTDRSIVFHSVHCDGAHRDHCPLANRFFTPQIEGGN